MDRYVVREARPESGIPGYPNAIGHQMVAFPQNVQPNNMVPDAVYYEGRYGGNFPGIQLTGNANGPEFMGLVHASSSHYPQHPQAGMHNNMQNVCMQNGPMMAQAQGQMMSGIDPAYLAAFAGKNAAYIAITGTGDPARDKAPVTPGTGYQNASFPGPDRSKSAGFSPHPGVIANEGSREEQISRVKQIQGFGTRVATEVQTPTRSFERPSNTIQQLKTAPQKFEAESSKNTEQTQIMSRSEKIKALQKSGTRSFSGPVDKVLKWHKALQDIGVSVIYEIVAKCVNVRPGDNCAKHLVIRDDTGPAMQVVYYEIDFLLPEIKPPCTIRVVGRMLSSTCRLQAFNVRPATGDDVTTLPRRAAVAAHHVAKLCKEFNVNLH